MLYYFYHKKYTSSHEGLYLVRKQFPQNERRRHLYCGQEFSNIKVRRSLDVKIS